MESTQTLPATAPTTQNVVHPNQISLPDHTQLPDSDGTFVKNFQEHPQSIVLTSSIEPVLQQLHPDKRYCIGQDSGIYWRLTEPPEPPEKGSEAPDWFYVPNVDPFLNGEYRRSYVMWQEIVAPFIAIEFVSGNGSEERDATPVGGTKKAGKFWVYEQAVRIPFYAIFDAWRSSVDVYHLVGGRYQQMQPNDRGHYPISGLGVELGIQLGTEEIQIPWLRWWDESGNLLLTGDERAVKAESRAVEAESIAEQERQEKLQEKLAKEQAEQLLQKYRDRYGEISE